MTLAFPKPPRTPRKPRRPIRRKPRAPLESAYISAVRAAVVQRERGLCRAWLDGHRFPWCQRIGAEMHEIVTRGAGGQVSLDNSILLCAACHEKRHGLGAWLRIFGTAAAVIFIARTPCSRPSN